jgi:hypothetical protein
MMSGGHNMELPEKDSGAARAQGWGRVDRLIKVILAPTPTIALFALVAIDSGWMALFPPVLIGGLFIGFTAGVVLLAIYEGLKQGTAALWLYVWEGTGE